MVFRRWIFHPFVNFVYFYFFLYSYQKLSPIWLWPVILLHSLFIKVLLFPTHSSAHSIRWRQSIVTVHITNHRALVQPHGFWLESLLQQGFQGPSRWTSVQWSVSSCLFSFADFLSMDYFLSLYSACSRACIARLHGTGYVNAMALADEN